MGEMGSPVPPKEKQNVSAVHYFPMELLVSKKSAGHAQVAIGTNHRHHRQGKFFLKLISIFIE